MGDFNWDEYVVEVHGRRYVDEEMVQAQLAAARAENERLLPWRQAIDRVPELDMVAPSQLGDCIASMTNLIREEGDRAERAEAEAAAERERAEKAEWMVDEAIMDGFTRVERMYPAGCDHDRRRIRAALEERYAAAHPADPPETGEENHD